MNAISATEFDITFVGNSGKQDHPEMEITAIFDERGNALPVSTSDIETLKEPSPEFRVNDAEYDDPGTMWLDTVNQRHPVVAIDSDGEFVIAWDSEVTDILNPGSELDVYARRFTTVGISSTPWTDANGETIQGVRPMQTSTGAYEGEFRVNSEVSGLQWYPGVGMDAVGNFLWSPGRVRLRISATSTRFAPSGSTATGTWWDRSRSSAPTLPTTISIRMCR